VYVADINELSLPKTCQIDFPDPNDLLTFKLSICPDEVIQLLSCYWLVLFLWFAVLPLCLAVRALHEPGGPAARLGPLQAGLGLKIYFRNRAGPGQAGLRRLVKITVSQICIFWRHENLELWTLGPLCWQGRQNDTFWSTVGSVCQWRLIYFHAFHSLDSGHRVAIA